MNSVDLAIGITGLVINLATICGMMYGFNKFLNKPKEDLETRVAEVEFKVKEHDECLKKGNDRFREQDDVNEVVFSIFLAFVNFEIAYCIHTGYEHNEDLLKAKETLEKHLAKGGK